ncbi:LytR/AlgR family response regulator transcription factor [Nonlabens marinus]|uniref:Putative two-component response regulator n=1 Tax=Nonlabens marinus S1-08 TaxID=1454201 RepID=W8VXH3_9FLAO|nr:LytTR family DNA-binding domain-containing protein [Nonlabens marinus]BAO55927.1 putative two-component response regulator [Nonlabens marinus S1-08]
MDASQNIKTTLKSVSAKRSQGFLWSWFQKLLVFTVFSLVVNHLSTPESFPDAEFYRFPKEGFLSTIALCILIGIIAELNFQFYRKKYFSKKVEVASIMWYMISTLGYITVMYIPLSIILNKIARAETEFYYLLIGLLITLLLSTILIALAYCLDIYNLYKLSLKDQEITIESGAKITKLTYKSIACFYSENKIVYAVQNDGTTVTTDFTLNELEEKINDQLFFRVNRQVIIHKDAVDQIEKIANGKLRIALKPSIENDKIAEISISRYKRNAFMAWFQKK